MIALFGGADPAYPRSRVLTEGLDRLRVPYQDLRVERRMGLGARWRALWRRYRRLRERPRWLVVPEFAHKDVPLAWYLAQRDGLQVAFDPLVSRHDTLVGDWALRSPGSLDASLERLIDGWSLSHADLVVCDTAAHRDLFVRLGCDPSRAEVIPVGAEERFWRLGERSRAEAPAPPAPLSVLYVGGFLPFHGVGVILDAAARLQASPARKRVRFTLVGDGIEYESVRRRLASEPLAQLRLVGRRSNEELADWIEQAEIVLGCFGKGEKSGRVIPHKVVQGLAAGRCVVTARSPAMEEEFETERHYVGVEPGEGEALAAALEALAEEPGRRAAIARAGRERARRRRTPEAVAAAWLRRLGSRLGPGPA